MPNLTPRSPRPDPHPPPQDFKVCRDFALSVYAHADRADRAGKADARLADAFSAAATFLKARPTSHWSPYDRVGVVNADP